MRAFTIEGAGRTLPPTAKVSETAPNRPARRLFARVGGMLAFVAAAFAVVTAIIAIRVISWGAGHPDQPFFRELSKLWG